MAPTTKTWGGSSTTWISGWDTTTSNTVDYSWDDGVVYYETSRGLKKGQPVKASDVEEEKSELELLDERVRAVRRAGAL